MAITARFYVERVTQIGRPAYHEVGGCQTAEEVKLRAIYASSPDDPNFSYSEATPQATIDATFTPIETAPPPAASP